MVVLVTNRDKRIPELAWAISALFQQAEHSASPGYDLLLLRR